MTLGCECGSPIYTFCDCRQVTSLSFLTCNTETVAQQMLWIFSGHLDSQSQISPGLWTTHCPSDVSPAAPVKPAGSCACSQFQPLGDSSAKDILRRLFPEGCQTGHSLLPLSDKLLPQLSGSASWTKSSIKCKTKAGGGHKSSPLLLSSLCPSFLGKIPAAHSAGMRGRWADSPPASFVPPGIPGYWAIISRGP